MILLLVDDIISGKDIGKFEWGKCVFYIGNILVKEGNNKINKYIRYWWVF